MTSIRTLRNYHWKRIRGLKVRVLVAKAKAKAQKQKSPTYIKQGEEKLITQRQ